MAKVVEYTLPLHLELGKIKKRKYFLNLNIYRNQAFHLNNDLKKAMKEIVKEVCPPFSFTNFRIEYELFLMDKRLRDISNVCCVIDKYQTDAVVELGYVPDDNYTFLKDVRYKFGGIDTENPRCVVRIFEVEE